MRAEVSTTPPSQASPPDPSSLSLRATGSRSSTPTPLPRPGPRGRRPLDVNPKHPPAPHLVSRGEPVTRCRPVPSAGRALGGAGPAPPTALCPAASGDSVSCHFCSVDTLRTSGPQRAALHLPGSCFLVQRGSSRGGRGESVQVNACI